MPGFWSCGLRPFPSSGVYGSRWNGFACPNTMTEMKKAATSDTTPATRSEEHTSELQSQSNLVCRLLLEKKKERHLDLINHSLHPTHNTSTPSIAGLS